MGGIVMNENLDLTKILKGCPKGTEFYSSVYGRLKYLSMYVSSSASKISFEMVNSRSMIDGTSTTIYYYRDGKPYPNEGECTLFPSKEQRDWSKFERFWDKPKIEKFDVNTLQPFDKVLVRDYFNERWNVDIFGFILNNYICCTTTWGYCIPYNEETKHLVGTNEDCPEFYKWWKE